MYIHSLKSIQGYQIIEHPLKCENDNKPLHLPIV